MIKTPKEAYNYVYNYGIFFPEDWQITTHFKWNEVFKNEQKTDGYPIYEVFQNAYKVALQMELIRCKCGDRPVIVHCWVRQIPHNKRVGSKAKGSSHINGMAVDFHVKGLESDEVRKIILDNKLRVRVEADTPSWVHVDIGNVYTNNYCWGLFNA